MEQSTGQGLTGAQDVGVPGATVAASEKEQPEQHIPETLWVEQYIALRSEIEKRIEIRQQILALTLLVAGTFLTIGVQGGISEVVVLFYPPLALCLGAMWEHNDLRIGQISSYIRKVVEPRFTEEQPGWEAYRRSTFSPRRKQKAGRGTADGSALVAPPGLLLFASQGVFAGSQLLALCVAAGRYLFTVFQQGWNLDPHDLTTAGPNYVLLALFGVDIVATLYTMFLVRHRRER
jgi:hypothetical protein